MEPLTPLDVASLFRPLLAELLSTLRPLTADDWERPTAAGRWRVRDVAAHLLDGDLRKIAACRDDHQVPLDGPIASDRDLVNAIHTINASGVAYAARLSPRLLVDLLETTGVWVADLLESLPPHEPARFPVSWAGEMESENWMDIGREYTERWHHQAQIRDATRQPLLLSPRWMEPLLNFSVRALPHAYAALPAPVGTSVALLIDGKTSAAWSVVRGDGQWQVFRGARSAPAATVRATTDDAWRLFFNGLPPDAARTRLQVAGDPVLAAPMIGARSVLV
jgi:uncharacterized protein (TIGR03083 family)